jgi:hypothetical protein
MSTGENPQLTRSRRGPLHPHGAVIKRGFADDAAVSTTPLTCREARHPVHASTTQSPCVRHTPSPARPQKNRTQRPTEQNRPNHRFTGHSTSFNTPPIKRPIPRPKPPSTQPVSTGPKRFHTATNQERDEVNTSPTSRDRPQPHRQGRRQPLKPARAHRASHRSRRPRIRYKTDQQATHLTAAEHHSVVPRTV